MNTLKTIVYMGSLHGFFTFYLPYQIALYDKMLFDLGSLHFLAFALWALGSMMIVQCSVDSIRHGRGTPAHLDPPKDLVIAGWYRHVRNPIYLGALLVLFGFIIWFCSALLVAYFIFFLVTYHILIIFFEEPVLRNKFGKTYEEYCQNVPRWVPKLR